MKIILASGSPRRRELLMQAGYEFEVRVSDADENVKVENPAKLVEELSLRKAKAVAKEYRDFEEGVIIGSDTVVALGNTVLGKPADEADAKEMLLSLSGREHQVYTGVSLIKVNAKNEIVKHISFHECTDVYMREMEEAEVLAYVATGDPLDKAGAYGIQGGAAIFISKIEGDYYNVVGLPICRLVCEMKQFLKKPQAVIFDMDGVIFDSERMYYEVWLKIGEMYGYEGMEEPALASIGVTWKETVELFEKKFGKDIPMDDMTKDFYRIAEEQFRDDQVPLKTGIRELLDYLKENNYIIGLASSSDREVIEALLDHHDLTHYFEHLTCGDEVKRSKPDPEIYINACKALGVDPKDAVAIEDSHNGIRSAYSAGMSAIMVPDMIGPNEEMEEKSVKILPDLFAVKGWFDAL